jgi:hypothetical protein
MNITDRDIERLLSSIERIALALEQMNSDRREAHKSQYETRRL